MKDTKKYFYLAGLPRTGSTVLGEILNQNIDIHVSPASPMSEVIYDVVTKWQRNEDSLKAYQHDDQLPNVWKGIRAGMYQHRSEKVIFDKSWAWQMNQPITMSRNVLNEEMKVICTVDNITDCLASFIMLIRNNPDYTSFIDEYLMRENKSLTDENRCAAMMNPDIPTSVGWCHNNLKKTYLSKNRQNLLLIERADLVAQPIDTINKIYSFIQHSSLSVWGDGETHYFDSISKEITENDGIAYGIPNLHKLGPKLRDRNWNAKEVLGNRLFVRYKKMEFWRSKGER
ncbi:MAG: sulfotransferase [Candidatus Azotimanducaceae bacterium]|jgi:sulfotransferase